jgi:hypothetical protein
LIDNTGVLDSFKLIEANAFPGTKKRKKKTGRREKK